MNFGEKLKSLRKENGYSIKKLIERLNEINIYVTEKTIYRWENNKVIPDIATIKTLAFIYNVNLVGIYEETKCYKSLTKSEAKFLHYLRTNSNFRKIVSMINKLQFQSNV